MNSWSNAFAIATKVADEHKDDPFFAKKRLHSSAIEEEHDDEEAGGFKQPRRLAQFAKSAITSTNQEEPAIPLPSNCESVENVSDSKSYGRPSLEERCAKQICRQWLKHEYLDLGEKCDGSCGRLHIVVGNPERLYKDFAFKGLTTAQRKTIIGKVKVQIASNVS
jgi:hypothetical protein